MKRKRIIAILTYVLLAAAWGAIFVSLFTACNVYEDTSVEVIRCPEIDADTVKFPIGSIRRTIRSNTKKQKR